VLAEGAGHLEAEGDQVGAEAVDRLLVSEKVDVLVDAARRL
jgi:hypothetical protein